MRGVAKGECLTLVLSRKKNAGIYIGDDIHIVVVEIRGDKCRLGVSAPDDVAIHRDEVYVAIQKSLAHKNDTRVVLSPDQKIQDALKQIDRIRDKTPEGGLIGTAVRLAVRDALADIETVLRGQAA